MVRTLCMGVLAVGLSAARAGDAKEAPEVAALKARLEAQAKELEALRKRVEEAEIAAVRAKNAERLARALADDTAKKVVELTAEVRELKRLAAGGVPVAPPPRPRGKPAPAARPPGEVTQVSGDLVAVNLGIDAGLKPGTVLELLRATGENESVFLGTVTFTEAQGLFPKMAVGSFAPARQVPLARLRPEELPRKGDTVRWKTDDAGK